MSSIKSSGNDQEPSALHDIENVRNLGTADYAKEVRDSIDAVISQQANSQNNDSELPAMGGLSIASMSDAEVMRLIKDQELQKQKERHEKYLRKMAMESNKKDHKFWDTQDPYNMPPGFEWCVIDVMDPQQIDEMYRLLTENYVEDDDCHFRFDYSREFLQWALTPPGYFPELHIGVRATKSRTKRLAPVLIKEVTRRVNLRGRWQATYTAGVVLPKPVGRCRYHHRSINPKKLIEIKFSSLPARTTLTNHLKNLKLPDKTTHHFRPAVEEDIPLIQVLLTDALKKCKLVQAFSVEELTHVLMSRTAVVSTYVHEVSSGYALPAIFQLQACNYIYSTSIENILSGADVFNALDLADNASVLEALKFGQGDGYLQYYLYNWKCPFMESKEVGLVLL
ncbi:unnamed protein product [Sphagnum jensenii]|uniref:Glycylpeptide N-tetradecanoyltransferase n=1 Tax=Sphagnum jensenii TaxID=128206 RepID=A0ABP0VAS8_9BRYO